MLIHFWYDLVFQGSTKKIGYKWILTYFSVGQGQQTVICFGKVQNRCQCKDARLFIHSVSIFKLIHQNEELQFSSRKISTQCSSFSI